MEQASDDELLWRRIATGDSKAFGTIFERHARKVFAFLVRRTADISLAEDLTSVTFLEAWRHRNRCQLGPGDSAVPWLLGIANNCVRSSNRSLRRYRRALARLPEDPSTPNTEDEAVARLDAQGALNAIAAALRSLSPEEVEAVVLVYWTDLSYEQAAETLGIPIGTVRSRLARARKKLGASLDPSTISGSEVSP